MIGYCHGNVFLVLPDCDIQSVLIEVIHQNLLVTPGQQVYYQFLMAV
jgi:hypothetical protein